MEGPNQRLTPRIQQRTWLTRIAAIGMVLASTVVWYRNSPLKQESIKDRSIRVEKREGFYTGGRSVQQSEAQQSLPMIRRSLASLKRLKHPSARQQQQIAWLEMRQKKVKTLADYELRLSLHQGESAAQFRKLRDRIRQIRTEVSSSQMP